LYPVNQKPDFLTLETEEPVSILFGCTTDQYRALDGCIQPVFHFPAEPHFGYV
jgi:hypothetical protein